MIGWELNAGQFTSYLPLIHNIIFDNSVCILASTFCSLAKHIQNSITERFSTWPLPLNFSHHQEKIHGNYNWPVEHFCLLMYCLIINPVCVAVVSLPHPLFGAFLLRFLPSSTAVWRLISLSGARILSFIARGQIMGRTQMKPAISSLISSCSCGVVKTWLLKSKLMIKSNISVSGYRCHRIYILWFRVPHSYSVALSGDLLIYGFGFELALFSLFK